MENDGGMRKLLSTSESWRVSVTRETFWTEDYRDYRVTNETDILEYFQDAIESISDRFVW